MHFAIALIIVSAAWRVLAVHEPAFSNFAPLMALAFCGGVYFRNRWLWLIPFAALTLSDAYLNYHYATRLGYEWNLGGLAARTACFAAALGIGACLAGRRNWLNLLGGALGGSLLFYLVTNSASWLGDPFYAKSAAGWWQAMTIGHPEFPPTLYFFRNTFISDLLFTGLFALTMEYAELRAGRPSLLGRPALARH
jgi:hypothetical protein